jgi:hypothetical protein
MQKFSLEHYAARRDECLIAAAACALENARQRHLDAAAAWQDIIDQLQCVRPTLGARVEFTGSAYTGLAR